MSCPLNLLHRRPPASSKAATTLALCVSLAPAFLLPASAMAQNPLLKALAEQGDAGAQLSLGKLYVEGRDVPRDLVSAHAWLSLSAEQGNAEAASLRDRIAAEMTPAALAEARRLAGGSKPMQPDEEAGTREAPKPSRELVADIRRRLAELGYAPGPVDGLAGEKTRRAAMAFQRDAGLGVDGELTEALRERLAAQAKKRPASVAAFPSTASANAEWASPEPGSIREPVELKASPSGDAPSLRPLTAGTPVRAIGKQGAWYEVEVLPGAERGWVKLASVRLGAEARAEAAPSGAGATEVPGQAEGLLGLDREDEFEADRVGVVIATRAGYDPYGLPAVLATLEGMSAVDASASLFFSTHPRPSDRIRLLDESMAGELDGFTGREGSERLRAHQASWRD